MVLSNERHRRNATDRWGESTQRLIIPLSSWVSILCTFEYLKTDPGWLSPGMQIEKCKKDLLAQRRLDLIEITRDTPTTIRCETIELDDVEKISETISFRIKGKIFFCLRLNFDDISKLTYCRNQWPDNRSGHHHSDGFLNFICGWNRRRHKIVQWSGNEIGNISINSFYVILIVHKFFKSPEYKSERL